VDPQYYLYEHSPGACTSFFDENIAIEVAKTVKYTWMRGYVWVRVHEGMSACEYEGMSACECMSA
jgi:hypothetical protein